nr:MAG TPA: hypothetical protein [Caudoviricetes sp.]
MARLLVLPCSVEGGQRDCCVKKETLHKRASFNRCGQCVDVTRNKSFYFNVLKAKNKPA